MTRVREVPRTFDGPTITCPSCSTRIAVESPTGWMIRTPRDVFDRLGVEMGALDREEMRVLILNAKNRVLRCHTAYVGNVSASLVRVGELFRDAVREQATGIVLVHNHPSGDPTAPVKPVVQRYVRPVPIG